MRVHDDHGNPFGPLFLHHLQGRLLGIGLDVHIQADGQIRPRRRLHPVLKGVGDLHTSRVGLGQNQAVDAFEPFLVHHFQADDPLVVASRKPKDLRGKAAVGIVAPVVLIHLYAVQMTVSYFVPQLLIHVDGHDLPGAVFFHLLPHLIRRYVKGL